MSKKEMDVEENKEKFDALQKGYEGEVYKVTDEEKKSITVEKRYKEWTNIGEIMYLKFLNYGCEKMGVTIFNEKNEKEENIQVGIPKLLTTYSDTENKLRVRIPFAENKDMFEVISDWHNHNIQLEKNQIVQWAYDVAKALFVSHTLGVSHLDVKPENILLTKNKKHAILSDWGIACFQWTGCQQHKFQGTIGYASPEMRIASDLQKDWEPALVWSFGVTFLLFLIIPSFIAQADKDVVKYVTQIKSTLYRESKITVTDMIKTITEQKKDTDLLSFTLRSYHGSKFDKWDKYEDLLSKCLVWDPSKRIKLDKLLNHPLFDDLRKSEQKWPTYFFNDTTFLFSVPSIQNRLQYCPRMKKSINLSYKRWAIFCKFRSEYQNHLENNIKLSSFAAQEYVIRLCFQLLSNIELSEWNFAKEKVYYASLCIASVLFRPYWAQLSQFCTFDHLNLFLGQYLILVPTPE